MGEVSVKSGNLIQSVTSYPATDIYVGSLYVEADLKPDTQYTFAFKLTEGYFVYWNEFLFTTASPIIVGKGDEIIIVTKTTKSVVSKDNINQYNSNYGGWSITKNNKTEETTGVYTEVQLLEGAYTSETIPEYQPYFLNRPAHQVTNGQWVDIPTHHYTNGRWQGELTSQSPLKFWADGEMLDWRIEGKTSGNLFDISTDLVPHLGFYSDKIVLSSQNTAAGFYVKCQPDTYYTLSRATNTNNRFSIGFTATEPVNGTPLLSYTPVQASEKSVTALSPSKANYLCAYLTSRNDPITEDLQLMLNEGSTALPYEPYGGVGDWDETAQKYRIPVTVNSVTTNIYTDHQLMEGDSIDYATDQTAIPLATGNNVLTVDTAVQPKSVFVKFEG